MKEGQKVISKRKNDDKVIVYIIRDTHWEEYIVQLWIDGDHLESADYYTDDKLDALRTSEHMFLKAHRQLRGEVA